MLSCMCLRIPIADIKVGQRKRKVKTKEEKDTEETKRSNMNVVKNGEKENIVCRSTVKDFDLRVILLFFIFWFLV